MTNTKISVQFQYSEAEYLAASRLLFFSTNNMPARFITFAGLMIAVAILLSLLSLGSFVLWLSLLGVVLFQVVLGYYTVVVIPRKYFRGDGKFQDRYELTFSDEGIHAKTAKIDSKLAWSLYTRAVEGRDTYVLLYGRDTRMMTAVPKRVFADKDQENRFRELVARHIVDSRLKSLPASESEYKPSSLTPPDWR